jgi:uncharacterized protein YutD
MVWLTLYNVYGKKRVAKKALTSLYAYDLEFAKFGTTVYVVARNPTQSKLYLQVSKRCQDFDSFIEKLSSMRLIAFFERAAKRATKANTETSTLTAYGYNWVANYLTCYTRGDEQW